MKTYEEYEQIIVDKARQKWEEQYGEAHRKHAGSICICHELGTVRTSFDRSVEIMGMMMQDFLSEQKELLK